MRTPSCADQLPSALEQPCESSSSSNAVVVRQRWADRAQPCPSSSILPSSVKSTSPPDETCYCRIETHPARSSSSMASVLVTVVFAGPKAQNLSQLRLHCSVVGQALHLERSLQSSPPSSPAWQISLLPVPLRRGGRFLPPVVARASEPEQKRAPRSSRAVLPRANGSASS